MAIGIIDMNGAISWDVIREAQCAMGTRDSRRRSPLARMWTSRAGVRLKPPESPASCPTANSTVTRRGLSSATDAARVPERALLGEPRMEEQRNVLE